MRETDFEKRKPLQCATLSLPSDPPRGKGRAKRLACFVIYLV